MSERVARRVAWMLAWCAVAPLHAQTVPALVLAGQVVSADDGLPLPGAHIFVAGSTVGTVTDAAGRYSLSLSLPGPVDLVVSMVGFARQQMRVASSDTTLVFRLAAAPTVLGEVEVTGETDAAWRAHLDTFQSVFFGDTRNAERCTLENPEVLDFTYDPDTKHLTAQAAVPLVFVNEALGYRVVYALDRFESDPTRMMWGGVSHFTELTPRDEKQRKQFEKERTRAYEGSPRHFLAALYADDLYAHRFRVYLADAPDPGKRTRLIEPDDWHTLLADAPSGERRLLTFDRMLMVTYTGEDQEARYRASFGQGQVNPSQMSWIELRSGAVPVDATGHVVNPYDLTFYGYWGWERAAELLPWDYTPE